MQIYKTMLRSGIYLYISLGLGISTSILVDGTNPTPFQDWDYLTLSQRWPITICTEWKEAKKDNICNMPKQSNIWSIHGLWPDKIGKSGPFFCDSAIHFDVSTLEPIEADLLQYWVNIEANTKNFSFWKHEWNKHGTCASVLPELNSVLNYFSKGLELARTYNISEILSYSKIVPSTNGYVIDDIYNAVKNNLSVIPEIECAVDTISKQSLINEIRICFNKSFSLIDCEMKNIHFGADIDTNCNRKKPVMYYGNMTKSIDYTYYESGTDALLNLYYLLKFLIWFTL